MAYVILFAFLFMTGILHYLTIKQLTATGPRGIYFPMQFMVKDHWFWLVFLFIPPLLTMRLLAEERSSGTLEMLMTAPLRGWQIVLSKYLACLAFLRRPVAAHAGLSAGSHRLAGGHALFAASIPGRSSRPTSACSWPGRCSWPWACASAA